MSAINTLSSSISSPLAKSALTKMPLPSQSLEGQTAPEGISFQKLMTSAISQVGHLQTAAQNNVEQSLLGADITQTEVFSSMKKADMALKMMVQIRNKLVEAFNEIQQIRV